MICLIMKIHHRIPILGLEETAHSDCDIAKDVTKDIMMYLLHQAACWE